MRKLRDALLRPAVLIAVIAALGTVTAAVVRAVNEYRLKAGSERAQSDVRLTQLFAELVPTANGRGKDYVTKNGEIEHAPVGEATQAAAIRSLGALGARYEVLREPAQAALRALSFVEDKPNLEPARQESLADVGE
jgi:hypothetical protein